MTHCAALTISTTTAASTVAGFSGVPSPRAARAFETRSVTPSAFAASLSNASVAAPRGCHCATVGHGCEHRPASLPGRHRQRPGHERRSAADGQQWSGAQGIRDTRFDAAARRLPFAAPVVIAHMRPDAFDHVGFLIDGMQHRRRAPALSPLHAARIGLLARLAIVVLAPGALLHVVFSVVEHVAAKSRTATHHLLQVLCQRDVRRGLFALMALMVIGHACCQPVDRPYG